MLVIDSIHIERNCPHHLGGYISGVAVLEESDDPTRKVVIPWTYTADDIGHDLVDLVFDLYPPSIRDIYDQVAENKDVLGSLVAEYIANRPSTGAREALVREVFAPRHPEQEV